MVVKHGSATADQGNAEEGGGAAVIGKEGCRNADRLKFKPSRRAAVVSGDGSPDISCSSKKPAC